MVERLRARAATKTKKELKALEQTCGLHFAPESLLFDDELREHYRPHSSTMWDWMHCVVASTGTAQYNLNA
eukprot:938879-Pyramimonas_sp.AAC.1